MAHLIDRENTVVFGTVAAILLSVVWSQRVRKTEQEYVERINFLESRLSGTRQDTDDYDSQLRKLEDELRRAAHAKAAVDEKLANAIKVSERAYASLVAADKQQSELEEEIRRLRALMNSSSAATDLLNSATTMSIEEREKFRLLLLQVELLESDLAQARRDLSQADTLKTELSGQINSHKSQYATVRDQLGEQDLQIEDLQKRLDEAQRLLREATSGKHDFESNLERTRGELALAIESLNRLENALADVNARNEELEDALERSKIDYRALHGDSHSRSAEANHLKEKLAHSNKLLSDTTAAHSTCDHRISELIKRAEAAESGLAIARGKVSTIERDMQASGSGTQLLASEKASLEATVKELQAELRLSEENMNALRKDVTQERSAAGAAEAAKKELLTQLNSTREEYAALQRQLSQSTEALSAAQKEHHASRRALEGELESSKSNLQATTRSAESYKQQHESTKLALSNLQTAHSDAQAKLSAMESEKMALSNDQQAVAQRIAELEGIANTLRSEKDRLNLTLQESDAKVQAGIQEHKVSDGKILALQAQLAEVQTSREQVQTEKTTLEQQLAGRNAGEAKAAAELQQQTQHVNLLSQQLKDAQEHLATSEAREADLKNAQNQAAKRFQDLQTQLAEATSEMKRVKEAKETALAEAASLESGRASLEAERQTLTKRVEDLDREVSISRDHSTSLASEHAKTLAELAIAIEAGKALESKHSEKEMELSNVSSQISAYEASKSTYEHDIATLKDERNSLRKQLEENGASDKVLLEKLGAVESQLQHEKNSGVQLEGTVQRLQKELGDVTASRDSAKGEGDKLKAEIDAAKISSDALQAARDQALEHVKNLEHQLSSLSSNHASIVGERDALFAQVGDVNAKLAEANAKAEKFAQQISDLTAQSSELTEQKHALEASLNHAKSLSEERGTEVAALKQALSSKEAEVKKHSQTASELNSKILALEAALAKSSEENQILHTSLSQKEDAITLSEKKNSELVIEIEKLRRLLDGLQAEHTSLQSTAAKQLDDIAQYKSNAEQHSALVTTHADKIKALQKEKTDLETTCSSLSGSHDRATLLEQQLASLVTAKEAADGELTSLRSTHGDSKAKIESLDRELSDLRSLHSRASTQLATEKQSTASLNAEVTSKEEELSALRSNLEGKDKEASDKIYALEHDLEVLGAKHDGASYRANELEKSLTSMQTRLSQSEAEKIRLGQTIDKLTARQAELQQDLSSARLLPTSPVAIDLATPSRTDFGSESEDSLNDEISVLKDKLRSSELEVDDKHQRLIGAKTRITELEEENRTLRLDFEHARAKVGATADTIGAMRETIAQVMPEDTTAPATPTELPGPGLSSVESSFHENDVPKSKPVRKRVSAFAGEGGDQLKELDNELASMQDTLASKRPDLEDYDYPILHVTSHGSDRTRKSSTASTSPESSLASKPHRGFHMPSFHRHSTSGDKDSAEGDSLHRERTNSQSSDHHIRHRVLSFLGRKSSEESLNAKDKDDSKRRSFIAAALPRTRADSGRTDSGSLVPSLESSGSSGSGHGLFRKHSKLHKDPPTTS